MPKRKPSPRTERRARARAHAELVQDLDRLARRTTGGSPARPRDVESPTQVEPIAEATPCPLCAGGLRLVEHGVEAHGGERLRVARMRCTSCGVPRVSYFRLAGLLPH